MSDSEDYDSSVAVFSKSTSRLSENVNNVNQSVQEGREDDEAVKNNREDNNALVVEKCIFNANECAHNIGAIFSSEDVFFFFWSKSEDVNDSQQFKSVTAHISQDRRTF